MTYAAKNPINPNPAQLAPTPYHSGWTIMASRTPPIDDEKYKIPILIGPIPYSIPLPMYNYIATFPAI